MVAVAAALGLAIRVVIMRTSVGVLDSDEAVVGLMARHFQTGAYRAFFWGQAYGGTIETAFTALLFRLFGPSTWVLRVVPLALNAGAAVLVWRVARRLISRQAAVLAAVLVWLWPANYLWWSIKARGFYEATLCLTLGCTLLVLRIAQEDGSRWLDWVLLGLGAGIGWWQSPQIAYVLSPVVLWLIAVRRLAVWRAVAAVPGFAVGALPWLVANLASGFASLVPPPAPVRTGYTDHLVTFVRESLPMTLGLKVVYLTQWITAPLVGEVLYGLAVALVVVGLVRRSRGQVLVGSVILAYPFLNSLLTLSGIINEGRYTLFLLPWLVIAMAHGADRRWARVSLIGIVAVVAAVGLGALRGKTSPYAPDIRVPTSMAPLTQSLNDHGVSRAWANYWIAYRLTFETGERLIIAPMTNGRYPQFDQEVRAARRPAFIFLAASRDADAFRRGLIARRIPFTDWTVGTDWAVYVPSVRVAPTAIPGSYT